MIEIRQVRDDQERRLIQAAFDHFKCTYVHRDDLFAFSTTIAKRYSVSGLCKKYLGSERYHPVKGYFQLPTASGSEKFVDDPDKYHVRDRQFELHHGINSGARSNREPTSKMLERTLQRHVTEVLPRIEPGMKEIRSFYRMRTESKLSREIDLLCSDARGGYVVIEFKRLRVKPRDIVGQLVEYIGMLKRKNATIPVRSYIIVDESWADLENAPLVIEGLKILRYADILPEIFGASPA